MKLFNMLFAASRKPAQPFGWPGMADRTRKIILSLFLLPMIIALWTNSGLAEDKLTVSLTQQEAGALSYLPINNNSILASVLDRNGEGVTGLTIKDFVITRGPQTAQIISVQDLAASQETGLNIVLVVDNSDSMERRKAIDPLLDALQNLLALVRPIDDVHVIVFANRPEKTNPAIPEDMTTGFKSNNGVELAGFLRNSFYPNTTERTYLYDAMVAGLDIIRQMPAEQQKFMIVFSDGEDINSRAEAQDVQTAASGLSNFSAYAIDYMDKPGVDPFLKSFTEANHGQIRKANSEKDFLPIIKSFSSTIFHRYVVNYRFINPPEGKVSIEPDMITVDELTIVDSSPLLNYVYFDTGESNIPARYVSLASQEETSAFVEENLRGNMEKYLNVLNIIGKRMVDHPEATLTLVGCISDMGKEKGNITLSKNRAEAVAAYLGNVWKIDAGRMTIKAQTLPSVPSTTRVPEGVVENQRVEIYANDPVILDTIKSTYLEEQADVNEVRVNLSVHAGAGIKNWQVTLLGDGKPLGKVIAQQGEPPPSVTFSLDSLGLGSLVLLNRISARFEAVDMEENRFTTEANNSCQVQFIQREKRIAEKLGYRVTERYALILFEFDWSEIKLQNQVIMNRIITKIKELPFSQVQIVGHTDTIGTEQYNQTLSASRAKAAYDMIMTAGTLPAGTTVNHQGVGSLNASYDNTLPEGRALNRTVVITINYATTNM